MKLRLPKALMTAMAAAVVAATPIAMTMATGVLVAAPQAAGVSLTLGDGTDPVPTSDPTTADDDTLTVTVVEGADVTWASGAQVGHYRVTAVVNVEEGATLNIASGASQQFGIFNKGGDSSRASDMLTADGANPTIVNGVVADTCGSQTINLAENARLVTNTSLAGWRHNENSGDPNAGRTIVNIGKDATWEVNSLQYLNQSTVNLSGGSIQIASGVEVKSERPNKAPDSNWFNTTADASKMSSITGGGKLLATNCNLGFDVALGQWNTSGTPGTDLLVDVLIEQGGRTINKTGTGVLEFTRANTSGNGAATNIKAGTLRLSGVGATGGKITVYAGATLELAHTEDFVLDNNVEMNGSLVVAPGGREVINGTVTGTAQHVTLADDTTLGFSGTGTNLTIAYNALTMGSGASFSLINGASLTLGVAGDTDAAIDKLAMKVSGDGTGKLHLNMRNTTTWGTHKVVALDEGTNLEGVYIDSGYLAMTTSTNPVLQSAAAITDMRGHNVHLADNVHLIIANNSGNSGNMGNVYLSGTSQLFVYGGNSVTFNNDFYKEGDGTALLKKTDAGTATLTGTVQLDKLEVVNGTLNVSGALDLRGDMTVSRDETGNVGVLNITSTEAVSIGGNVIFTSNVSVASNMTVQGGIKAGAGTLTLGEGALVYGGVDMRGGNNTWTGSVVVTGGTLDVHGTISSRNSGTAIKLQGDAQLLHSSATYSVREGLANGAYASIYTNGNVDFDLGSASSIVENATVSIDNPAALTLNATLINSDLVHASGAVLTIGGTTQTIRNFTDISDHGITNTAALTITGTLDITSTLTNSGNGSITFDASKFELNHGLSAFDSLGGGTVAFSQGENGYITGGTFVLIDSSANAANLTYTGEFSDSHMAVDGNGRLLYTIDPDPSDNGSIYYINNNGTTFSEAITLRDNARSIMVTNGHDLMWGNGSTNSASDVNLETEIRGTLILSGAVDTLGQTPGEIRNIRVASAEGTPGSATVAGSINGLDVANTTLDSGASLTFEHGTESVGLGNVALNSGSTLTLKRNASLTLAATASNTGKLVVSNGDGYTSTVDITMLSGYQGAVLSGNGTINLTPTGGNVTVISSNDFSGTLNVTIGQEYFVLGTDTQGGVQTFTGNPDLVLSGGNGNYGLVINHSFSSSDTNAPTANALQLGSIATDSTSMVVRGDWATGSTGHRYISLNQSKETTFAGVFMDNATRSVGLVMNGTETGNLILTNANASQAGLIINSGTVTMGGENGSWKGAVTVNAGGTLAYAGAAKEILSSQTISFVGAATLKVGGDTVLTLKKSFGNGTATLLIEDGGKLVLGTGSGWAGKITGGEGATVVFQKTGTTDITGSASGDTATTWSGFSGTLDISQGSVYVGGANGLPGGSPASFSATNVVVRNGASFVTHFGADSDHVRGIGTNIYTESGSTIGNKDGYCNWDGKIYLNVAEGSTPGNVAGYDESGVTTFNMHWDKVITWNNYVYGSGVLEITSGDTNDDRILALAKDQTQEGAFNGTYRLSNASNKNYTELRLNAENSARDAKVDLSSGKVRLAVNTNSATIAGLSGESTSGVVRAMGANGTLVVQQADDGEFAGTFVNYTESGNTRTISLTKNGTGHLVLTGANTSTGTLTVNAGTVTLGGDNGAWVGNFDIGANATLVISGNVAANSSKFEGSGTITITKDVNINSSTGNTFSGTVDIVSGTFALGNSGSSSAKGSTDFFSTDSAGTNTVLVHRGATFQTNTGGDTIDFNTGKTVTAAIYAEDGSTLRNTDGHINIDGGIHVNVKDVTAETKEYVADGSTDFEMYWSKYVVLDALIAGEGTLNITGTNVDTGKTHRLVLNNGDNTFNGTYKLNGKTDRDNDGNAHKMELYINQENAAKNATVEIAGPAGSDASLVIGTDAQIAGLKGATGKVKADGGEHTLTINQTADTSFAGAFTSTDDNALNVTKSGNGELKLTGANTVETLSVQGEGSLAVSGSGSIQTVRLSLGSDASVKLYTSEDGASSITTDTVGSMKNVTLSVTAGEATIVGAKSGEGAEGNLKALGEMTKLDITAVAAMEVQHVTMKDVHIDAAHGSGVAVTYDNATAVAMAPQTQQRSFSMGPVEARADGEPLTATTVQTGGSISGALKLDLDSAFLGPDHVGETLKWTILDNVNLESDFRLVITGRLWEVIAQNTPKVTISVEQDGLEVMSERVLMGNINDFSTADLFAGYTGHATVIMTIENLPEPTTGTLGVLALAGLAARRRRKR